MAGNPFSEKILKSFWGISGLPKDVLGSGECLGSNLESLGAIWKHMNKIEKKVENRLFGAIFAVSVQNGMVLSPLENK